MSHRGPLRSTVNLCSYKDSNPLLWTPKAVISIEINGKWEDYPVQWDEKDFFFRHEANKYALKKSKEWLSRNTQIKEKRIFTKGEWVEHKISLALAWIIGFLFLVVALIAVFMSLEG